MSKKKKRVYKLRPKQQSAKILLTAKKYWDIELIGYGGAAEGGKSFLAADWIIDMCTDENHTNLKYSACAFDIEKAKATIKDKFEEVAKAKGLKKDVHYTYNKNDHEFTFLATGSRVVMFGLPTRKNNDWLKGYEWTGTWVDESDTVEEAVLLAHYKRVGRVNNTIFIHMDDMTEQEKIDNPDYEKYEGYDKVVVPTKMLETFNPSSGHTTERFYIPYRDKTQLEMKPKRIFVRAYPQDNYQKGSERLKRLASEPEGIEKDKSFYGRFDINYSERSIFNGDAILNMFKNKVEHTGYMSAVIDVAAIGGKSDKTKISIWNGLDMVYIEDLNHLKTFEELRDYIKSLLVRYDVMNKDVVIDANGIGSMLTKSREFKGCKSYMSHNSVIKEEVLNINGFKKGRNVLMSKFTGRYGKLKDQCTLLLSDYVNDGLISLSCADQKMKDTVKRELLIYEVMKSNSDVIRVTQKTLFRKLNSGRSPDTTDLMVMRMYLELIDNSMFKPIPKSERKFIKKKKKKRTYV